MRIKFYLLCLLFLGFTNAGFSQMTIATKVGILPHQPTYVYNGISFHDDQSSPGLAIALAFRQEIGHRLALGTELGFNNFTNELDISTLTQSIVGRHSHQQTYLALVPQYSFTKQPGLVFVNAGFLLFMNTRSDLETSSDIKPMNIGSATTGMFIGIGGNLHIEKLGIQLEIRPTFQDQSLRRVGSPGPDKFKLYYTNIFWGLTYHFD